MFGFDLKTILINVPITLVALTGHELAHAWVSTKLGDPTPRMQGRLSWNPLHHLDLFGTLMMILTGFGWARAVEINPMYYKDRKKGTALVSFAGPFANFLMAFAAMLIYAALYIIGVKTGAGQGAIGVIGSLLYLFAFRNLCLMVFNLIPIPPLDGSKVLGMFLPNRQYYAMMQYQNIFMIILMVLCLTGIFSNVIGTGVNFVFRGIMNVINGLVNIVL